MASKRMSRVIEKEEDNYIPEYTLDRIEEEVCKKMPAIMQYASWDDVIPACIMIEHEPLGIYGCLNNTVNEATKNVILSGQYIRAAIKFRIYMLLYYMHRDSELYKISVFPILIAKMKEEKFDYGIEWINRRIDRIIELEWKVKELQGQVNEKLTEEESTEKTDWHDKVRLELALRLMEKAGADVERYGNKTKVARILQTITKLPFSTCKNYVTNRDLNHKKHEEEVLEINATLQDISVDVRI